MHPSMVYKKGLEIKNIKGQYFKFENNLNYI